MAPSTTFWFRKLKSEGVKLLIPFLKNIQAALTANVLRKRENERREDSGNYGETNINVNYAWSEGCSP